ncbi:hypothetical protein PFTANZ_05894 [Plasmodium falciparum Tanzania (2000708)]|uniref:Surface antigen n=1 Tax=Plasmodium falciparum Tanzania (2000708) TaxID=1036725 RepID=A0A024VYL7_PLAFA|nr:hypothetical protein PFTANZ_05894 [Plasmodium falciparum Tanzania (2000708)]
MKIHYINILLFVIPLNILVYNQRNYYITPRHTETNRSLCECELYAPANYDNDPQMKKIMENFDRQTSQRFHEYDERMQGKRQKCKDKCDKEIQKIILKDKLEKELMDKFATLQTDIQSDAIPTCICEKSMADKMEKDCLRCTYGLGTLAPTVGLIGSVAVHVWKPKALAAAIKAALNAASNDISAAAEAARIKAGIEAVISGIKSKFSIDTLGDLALKSVITEQKYNNITFISGSIQTEYSESGCRNILIRLKEPICTSVEEGIVAPLTGKGVSPEDFIKTTVETIVKNAKNAADAKAAEVAAAKKAAILETSTKAIETTSYNWYTTIGYSITAILIIVLIMVIIYLILRYRRKKKMKKKLQYIKLLKE